MDVDSLWGRHRVGLVGTSLFVTVLIFVAMCHSGWVVQDHRVSRGGVPPEESWEFTIMVSGHSADMTSVNREIVSVLSASGRTVVYAAEYGMFQGRPVLAVYDNRPNPESVIKVEGRWFTAQEMEAGQPALILRHASYLLEDPNLGGHDTVFPEGAVIGTFPTSIAISYEVVTTIMSYFPSVLPNTVYLRSDDPGVAESVLATLNEQAHVMVSGPEALSSTFLSYRYMKPLAIACLTGLLILAMVAVDSVGRDRPRWRVERLVGSSASSAALRAASGRCLGSLLASAVATAVLYAALAESLATLPPDWVVGTVVVSASLPAATVFIVAFAATRWRRLGYREWLA